MLDGQDITNLNPKWFQKNLCLVSQEPQLFAMTIKENICFALEHTPSDAEIIGLFCFLRLWIKFFRSCKTCKCP